MASGEELNFNDPHAPKENSIEAFDIVLPKLKEEILKSRKDWDLHEPKMWSRAAGISDEQLVDFAPAKDVVTVRSAATTYGTIVLAKIRLPAVNDDLGEGFVHVRIHDPPNRGNEDVMFHSLFTDEGNRDSDGRPTTWRAIQTKDAPLEFFNE